MTDNDNVINADDNDTAQIKEPTAFYRELLIAQSPVDKIGFEVKEVYDDIYKAMLPHLFKYQRSPRALATVGLSFIFDMVTNAMAITEYTEEMPFEGDLQQFAETVITMLNATNAGIGANARLLIDKKSIFNIKEKLDS